MQTSETPSDKATPGDFLAGGQSSAFHFYHEYLHKNRGVHVPWYWKYHQDIRTGLPISPGSSRDSKTKASSQSLVPKTSDQCYKHIVDLNNDSIENDWFGLKSDGSLHFITRSYKPSSSSWYPLVEHIEKNLVSNEIKITKIMREDRIAFVLKKNSSKITAYIRTLFEGIKTKDIEFQGDDTEILDFDCLTSTIEERVDDKNGKLQKIHSTTFYLIAIRTREQYKFMRFIKTGYKIKDYELDTSWSVEYQINDVKKILPCPKFGFFVLLKEQAKISVIKANKKDKKLYSVSSAGIIQDFTLKRSRCIFRAEENSKIKWSFQSLTDAFSRRLNNGTGDLLTLSNLKTPFFLNATDKKLIRYDIGKVYKASLASVLGEDNISKFETNGTNFLLIYTENKVMILQLDEKSLEGTSSDIYHLIQKEQILGICKNEQQVCVHFKNKVIKIFGLDENGEDSFLTKQTLMWYQEVRLEYPEGSL